MRNIIGLNINTIITALVLGGVVYLASTVTSANNRLIALEATVAQVLKDQDRRITALEYRLDGRATKP